MVNRNLLGKIKPFLKRDEFLSIIGPRQSGKTTFLSLLKHYLLKELKVSLTNVNIITFEDRKLLHQFEEDPVSFLNSYLPSNRKNVFYLMIDEFQYAKNGGQYLKLIYDTVPNVKIIITGSSSLEIRARTGKYMVGRMLSFFLYPFNFEEFLRGTNRRLEKIFSEGHRQLTSILLGKRIKQSDKTDPFSTELLRRYEEYCIWGGYPAVALTRSAGTRQKILADIYNNYVLKDVKTILALATEDGLYRLTLLLSSQIGNLTVQQNLCRETGLDYRDLKKHLNLLEETYVCRQVRPFFTNRQKELSKIPKIFFIDMGFRNYLMENMNPLSRRPDTGNIVENTVFIRLNEIFRDTGKLNFWRTKAGTEVDFILQREGKILPIEVKFSVFTGPHIPKNMHGFLERFKPERCVVLTKNFMGHTKKGKTNVYFMPVYYL